MRRDPQQIKTARRLRRDLTPAEAKLWQMVRSGRLGGWKFRRQHPIGPYSADFCCVAAKLIVELDGDSHLGRQERDEARERYLRGQGYEILRFENFEVMLSENAVLERIVWVCRNRMTHPFTPNLSPQGARGASDAPPHPQPLSPGGEGSPSC